MEEELDPKNIYVIRQKLATLNKAPGQNHYEYYAGKFKVSIWTHAIQDPMHEDDSKILDHATVDIDLHEIANRDDRLYNWVMMHRDIRFIDYEPIQYHYLPDRRLINRSGRDMPILQLCELIKYLYRLSNLTAFM